MNYVLNILLDNLLTQLHLIQSNPQKYPYVFYVWIYLRIAHQLGLNLPKMNFNSSFSP